MMWKLQRGRAPWVALLLSLAAQPLSATDFQGSGTGPIPDRVGGFCGGGVFGAPLDVTFEVSGLAAPITDVAVSISMFHTWAGDLDVVLIAPTGESHALFSRLRANFDSACGVGSDFNGAYVFNDQAAGPNLWDAAVNNPILGGAYRTTEAGGAGQVIPAPITDLTAAFSALADPNGTWTLRFRDTGAGDTGTVSAATLSIPATMVEPDPPVCNQETLMVPAGDISGDFLACNSITTSGAVRVVGAGATFKSASVALANGFSVASGVPFTVESGGFNPGAAIPDQDPAGVALALNVSGLTQVVSRVSVELDINHTSVGDLTVILTSPGGVSRLVLLGRPGHRPGFAGGNAGISANLAGTYSFDDFAPNDFWATMVGLGDNDTISPGNYRASTAAPFGPSGVLLSNAGGCVTHLSGAFSGLTAAQANGTWSLQVVDSVAANTGSVTEARLWVEQSPSVNPNPIQGSSIRGLCTPTQFDFTGTGRTSYALLRFTGSNTMQWLIKGNDGTAGGQPEQSFVFGDPNGFVVSDDYDGDGIWDPATWTSATGRIQIRRSSRPTDVPLEFNVGANGDNPTLSGDYDGDRVADPTAIHFPMSAGLGELITLPSSLGGLATSGFSTLVGSPLMVFPDGGLDRTGDGVADVGFQTEGPSGEASWTIFNGASGAIDEIFDFGLHSDIIVPGNRAGGDPAGAELADTTVVRMTGSTFTWFVRDAATGTGGDGTPARPGGGVIHGQSLDVLLGGDFDGDGVDDIAVWVSGPVFKFLIRQSSSPSPLVEFVYGTNFDYPVANSRVN